MLVRRVGSIPVRLAALLLALMGTPVFFGGMPPRDALAADAAACTRLQGRHIGPGLVVAATFARPPYRTSWMNSREIWTTKVPFCRLEAVALPSPRSHVGFEVWLPARSHWNGRFLGVGAGGSMGDVNRLLLAGGVNRGFASAATDNGHRSPSVHDDDQWALGERQRIVDFGYRAQHVATVAGKAAVRAYYGRAARYAYYYGTSQGGHHGMMEAQRFPADYDGIVAGSPVYSWVGEMTQQAWTVRALTKTPGSALDVPHLDALMRAVVRRCAGRSGLVEDPRRCDFDPAQLACPQPDAAICLTPEQVTAVRKIYEGPHTGDGRRIYPGFPRGSERGWSQLYGKVDADGTAGGGSWLGLYRYMVFDDPTWTLPRLDFDRDPAYAESRLKALLDPDDPDLDVFARRGGKLIVWHGWADQQVPAQVSVDYHEAVVARNARNFVDGFFRLFMIPGMLHSKPFPMRAPATPPVGPNLVLHDSYEPGVAITPENDALTAMQDWVEHGRAPSHFIVRLEDETRGITRRTVLACPWPAAARYRAGDPLDARNWQCMEAAAPLSVGP